jgi:hypothetical protein
LWYVPSISEQDRLQVKIRKEINEHNYFKRKQRYKKSKNARLDKSLQN